MLSEPLYVIIFTGGCGIADDELFGGIVAVAVRSLLQHTTPGTVERTK